MGRLILDGVVDADVYKEPVSNFLQTSHLRLSNQLTKTQTWMDSMVDADVIIDKFFYYCHVSRELCALYRRGDSPSDIKARFSEVIIKLQEEPVIVAPMHVRVPITVTASDIRQMLFSAIYSPVKLFPVVALVLDLIYRDEDITALATVPDLTAVCAPNLKLRHYPDESNIAISCSDRQYKVCTVLAKCMTSMSRDSTPIQVDESLAGLQKRFDEISQRTSFADVVSLPSFPSGRHISQPA